MKKNKLEEEVTEETPIEEEVIEESPEEPVEETTETPEEAEPTEETPVDEIALKKKKKKKIIIIVSIVIAVLLIIGLVVFLLTRNKKEDKKETAVDQITITFDSNGGNKIEPLKVDKNGRVNYPIPERENHLFIGWYNVEEKVLRTTTFDKDVTLTAHWEELKSDTKTMVISYDTKGKEKLDSETIVCGTPIDLPYFYGDGYYLRGWIDNDGKEIVRGTILPCQDITLHANLEDTPIYGSIKCPNGYYPAYDGEQEGKCYKTTSTYADCKNGTVNRDHSCYDLNDTVKYEKKCDDWAYVRKEDGSLTNFTGEGEFINDELCGYYVWEGYTEETCKSKYEGSPIWSNGKCYGAVEEYQFRAICPEGYTYFNDIDKCAKEHDEYLTCPNGYELNKGGWHSCVLYVDPIE